MRSKYYVLKKYTEEDGIFYIVEKKQVKRIWKKDFYNKYGVKAPDECPDFCRGMNVWDGHNWKTISIGDWEYGNSYGVVSNDDLLKNILTGYRHGEFKRLRYGVYGKMRKGFLFVKTSFSLEWYDAKVFQGYDIVDLCGMEII